MITLFYSKQSSINNLQEIFGIPCYIDHDNNLHIMKGEGIIVPLDHYVIMFKSGNILPMTPKDFEEYINIKS